MTIGERHIVFKPFEEPYIVTAPLPSDIQGRGTIITAIASGRWFYWKIDRKEGPNWELLPIEKVPKEYQAWALILS